MPECGIIHDELPLGAAPSPVSRVRPESSRSPPEAKAAEKRTAVAPAAGTGWQALDQLCVPSPDDHVVDLQRSAQAGDDVSNVLAPFLLAESFEASFADILLIGPSLF